MKIVFIVCVCVCVCVCVRHWGGDSLLIFTHTAQITFCWCHSGISSTVFAVCSFCQVHSQICVVIYLFFFLSIGAEIMFWKGVKHVKWNTGKELSKTCLHINEISDQWAAMMQFVVVDFDCCLIFPIATDEIVNARSASFILQLDIDLFNVTSHLSVARQCRLRCQSRGTYSVLIPVCHIFIILFFAQSSSTQKTWEGGRASHRLITGLEVQSPSHPVHMSASMSKTLIPLLIVRPALCICCSVCVCVCVNRWVRTLKHFR